MKNVTIKNMLNTSIIDDNCSLFLDAVGDGCLDSIEVLNFLLDSNTEGPSGSSSVENRVQPSYSSRPAPLISDEVTYILEIIIMVIGLYLTSFFGVFANVINTMIYGKQGLKDSITIGLFALSLSDLVVVIMPLMTASLHVADYISPNHPVDFPSLHYVSSGWVRNMMYSMSCFITALLSLERCCCIILPFKVRSIFTRGKTAFIIIAFFLLQLACLLMLPAAYELTWWPSYNYSVSNNMSRIYRVVFFEEGEVIEVFNTTVMSLIVPTVTQVIVTICVVVMIHGLRMSAKFRNTAAVGKIRIQANSPSSADYDTQFTTTDVSTIENLSAEHTTEKTNGTITNKPPPTPQPATAVAATVADSEKEKSSRSNNLTGRDARLIKTMIFLVSIQSACNIPFLAATFAWRSVPDMNIGMAYENTLRVVFSIVYLLGNLNASCNVFVYYHTSSSFRSAVTAMCCFREKGK